MTSAFAVLKTDFRRGLLSYTRTTLSQRYVFAASSSIVLLIAFFALAQTVIAHGGGTPRLSGEQAGPYRVYAWSEPEPLREGETHLTIGLTVPSVDSGFDQDETPITDAAVTVTYTRIGDRSGTVTVPAQAQDSLGTVYYEADADLPSSGHWRVSVSVEGVEGSGTASFDTEVMPARRVNGVLVGVSAAIVVALLALVAVRSRRAAGAGRSVDGAKLRAAGAR